MSAVAISGPTPSTFIRRVARSSPRASVAITTPLREVEGGGREFDKMKVDEMPAQHARGIFKPDHSFACSRPHKRLRVSVRSDSLADDAGSSEPLSELAILMTIIVNWLMPLRWLMERQIDGLPPP
jgi:hypothetical protein